MRISCIIVEDEPLALERMREYVEKAQILDLRATFERGLDALIYLRANAIDVVFLDLNLGELSGIQLLEEADIRSQVIITTAYPEHALKGYDLNVTDYLLKPFTFERFFQAVEKARKNLAAAKGAPPPRFMFVKTENRLEKVPFRELLFIEGMRDYRRLHLLGKRIMTLKTFREFERELPERVICRVHKSYMVALERIDSIERDRIKIRDAVIPISETYRKRFFQLLELGKK